MFVGPPQTVFVGGGYTVFTLPSIIPSVRDVLVFQYLEKAMMEFHKICQTIDIHKMNIYDRQIKARRRFF